MGKKKITKEPKGGKSKPKEQEPDEPVVVPEPTPAKKKTTSRKSAPKNEGEINIFSESFKDRISEFSEFYKEFLSHKAAHEDADLSGEMDTVTKRVSENIELACSKVLKEELVSTEEWIKEQQKAIQDQIGKVENAYDENKKSLEATGTFSDGEIKNQLKPISDKK